MFSWDPLRQRYRYTWFESSGASLNATAELRDAETLVLDWENGCTQTFQPTTTDTVVLEMRCPAQGLTLRVDMSRRTTF